MYRRALSLSILLFAPATPVALSQALLAVESVRYLDSTFQVLHVDLRSYNLELHWKDEDGKPLTTFARLEQFLQRRNQRLLFSTNAGIYDVGFVPHGLHVQDGQQLVPINRKGNKCSQTSNFHMKPNGIFLIAKDGARVVETERYDEKLRPFLATQSGPLLVLHDQINPCFRESSHSTYIRNGIGVRTPQDVYIAISESPVNLYTIAGLFKEVLACPNALYLDGAISSICQDCSSDERFRYAGMLAVTQKED